MKLRKPTTTPPADGIPEWVRCFAEADWDDGAPPPPWWTDSLASWQYFHARRRWSRACGEWGMEHPEVDLFALHYPETAANLAAARSAFQRAPRPLPRP